MAWSIKHNKTARFYCRSHDAMGYNMLNRADPNDDRNVSERAINRTYHKVYVEGSREWTSNGKVTIDKNGNEIA
jgi:hypothetical protein